jgi:hypothetical protein
LPGFFPPKGFEMKNRPKPRVRPVDYNLEYYIVARFRKTTKYSAVNLSLYINLESGQTPKAEVGKNYLVWYLIFEKKETSCKEIVWGQTTPNYKDRRFLMNEEDRRKEVGVRLILRGGL